MGKLMRVRSHVARETRSVRAIRFERPVKRVESYFRRFPLFYKPRSGTAGYPGVSGVTGHRASAPPTLSLLRTDHLQPRAGSVCRITRLYDTYIYTMSLHILRFNSETSLNGGYIYRST